MHISEFDYHLPDELIAQEPLADRGASRMMVVDRSSGEIADRSFTDLAEFLHAGDVLVLNNTKVFPARLLGQSETGAKVEVFLVRELSTSVWEALARPARRLPIGKRITFSESLSAVVVHAVPAIRLRIRLGHRHGGGRREAVRASQEGYPVSQD